jgi:hypothetical protein
LVLKAAKVDEEMASAATETDIKIHSDLAEVKARLAIVEKLQWVVIAGVIVLLIKAYLMTPWLCQFFLVKLLS